MGTFLLGTRRTEGGSAEVAVISAVIEACNASRESLVSIPHVKKTTLHRQIDVNVITI